MLSGHDFVIAAGGASLSIRQARAVGMAKSRHPEIKVIAVNDAVYPFAFADMLYACDAAWWREHGGVKWFGGWKCRLRVVNPISGRDTNNLPEYPEVDSYLSSGTEGFDDDPAYIRHGGNSGYQALHIAAHLGARRVILLGFDMKGKHWFGDHPRSIRKNPWNPKWVERFGILAKELDKRGIVVLNASPDSALACFTSVDLETAMGENQWSSRKPPPRAARKR